jgi:capsid protein
MPVRLPSLGGLFNRAQRRGAPDHLRRFDAAGGGRRGSTLGSAGPVHSEVAAAAHLVNARARHAYFNNPLLRHAAEVWATYLVGHGCRPTPLIEDTELRRRLTAAFDASAEDIDAHGRTNFAGLLRALALHLVVDGEALAIIRYDDGGRLRLQTVLPEQLDAAKTTDRLPGGGWITNGVEHDAMGVPVAYWILRHRPHSLFTDYAPSERFDAADVLHVFLPLGAGQVRGISWFAPVLTAAADLDDLTDALRVGTKVAAMFGGFITDPSGSGGCPSTGIRRAASSTPAWSRAC